MNAMSIELRKIDISHTELPYFKVLYEQSFPPEERRPWNDVVRQIEYNSRFSFYEILKDSDTVGFITLWNLDSVFYGEHFAIDPSRRNGGLGGVAFDTLLASLDMPFVCEVEHAGSTPEAASRIGFYVRHGLVGLNDYDYMQPPYAPGLPSVSLMLMTDAPADIDPADVTRMIHHHVYGC